MPSPYDPEAVAAQLAAGVTSTMAALREENARLTRERDEAREKLARCVEALEAVHWGCPGWISVTVPAHDPRCDGTCSAGCPVPVEEQEQCQVCAALAAAKGE